MIIYILINLTHLKSEFHKLKENAFMSKGVFIFSNSYYWDDLFHVTINIFIDIVIMQWFEIIYNRILHLGASLGVILFTTSILGF